MIKVSIIVPTYNAEKYINRCLDSLINQTLKEIEIIVVNDGSQDNTLEKIKKYTDKRIKLLNLKENKGIGHARNEGIKKALGQYIGFVDSDDYVDKNMFEKIYEKASKEKLDILVCDYYKQIENTKQITKEIIPNFKNTTLKDNPNLLLDINLAPWNKIYNRELIVNNKINFDEKLKYEDVPFVVKTLDKAKKIGKLNKCLNYYVVHNKSETTIRDEKVFDIIKIVDKVRKYFKDNASYKEVVDKLTVRILTNYTIQQRTQQDKYVAMKFINDAFSYLKKEVPDYKDNKYYKLRPFFQKTIEKNKFLSKAYCKLYQFNNKNLFQKLISIFFIFFSLIFSFIVINDFVNPNYLNFNSFNILVWTIVYFLIIYLIYRFIKNKVKKHNLIQRILLLLIFVIQLIFAYFFVADELTWDFGSVTHSAIEAITGKTPFIANGYLYAHPNNIGITLILKLWFSLFNTVHFYHYKFLGIILNIIIIDLGIYFLYKILKSLFTNKMVTFFLLLTVTFTPLITYVPIFYTDTMSIAFGIGGIYYFLKQEKSSKYTLYNILCGILIGIGTCIKFTIIIVLISLLIFLFFKEGKIDLKNIFKKLLLLILGFIIPYLSLQIYINNTFKRTEMNKLSFPATHYIMMGLKGVGGYDFEDQDYTGKFDGIKAKEKANIKVIKSRIENHINNNTLFKHFSDKIVYVWGDGTFFAPEKLSRGARKNYKFKKYIINNDKNQVFKTFAQCQLIFMLIFIIIGSIFRNYLNETKRNLQLILNISIFGIFIFFLIWEARSRYIVNFIPILLLSSFLGIESLINYFKIRKEHIK